MTTTFQVKIIPAESLICMGDSAVFRSIQILHAIDKELVRRNSRQGKFFNGNFNKNILLIFRLLYQS